MRRQTTVALVTALALLVGTSGVVAAQPADGPPADLPDPVPDFVSNLLGTIGDFVAGTISALGDAVRSITPGGDDVPPVTPGP